MAGAVAEVVSGRSWSDLVTETYVGPCGIDSLGFTNQWAQFGPLTFEYPRAFSGDPSTIAPTANPNMEGGAYISAPDYAELLLMQLRAGRCGETPVLSAESVERMHTDRVIERSGPTGYPGLAGYGLGWWVRSPADGYVTDPGAYGLHYELELNDDEAALLQAADPADIALMLVLYKQEDAGAPIRANLQAPLLINTRSRRGLQKVMPRIEPRVTLKNLSVPA